MQRVVGLLSVVAFACACGSSSSESDSLDEKGAERAAWVREQVSEHNAWLSEEVRSEKYGAMAKSAFAFFRGTDHLYWADFAGDERLEDFAARTFLQGDLHVGNYGSFDNDEGTIVYDVNDFDEGVVGDYQLDLWRGAVSIVLVGNQLGLETSQRRDSVDAFAKGYLDACESFVGNDDENDRVVTPDKADGALADFLAEVATKTRAALLEKWTVVVDGKRVLAPDHEDLAPFDDRESLVEAFAIYGETLSGGLVWDESYFAVKDVALRLHAGVGSLGSPRYYVLIEGPTAGLDDDILLDVKYVARATGLEYMKDDFGFATEAERAVAAQKALLVDTDDHLGWFWFEKGTYVVRERSPYKDDIALEDLNPSDLESLAAQWGAILAADHARADRDFDDSLEKAVTDAASRRRSNFYSRVWDIASGYAAQVEEDWHAFLPLAD